LLEQKSYAQDFCTLHRTDSYNDSSIWLTLRVVSVLFFDEVVETIDSIQIIEALLGIFVQMNINNSAIGQ
jgi:hypothetical protein